MSVTTPLWREVVARVVRHDDRGAGHRWLEVEVDGAFESPEPGQFVMLKLPAIRATVFLPRPMSVASVARSKASLRLGFLYVPTGHGTAALAGLENGAALEVLGPLGRGFPLAEPGTPVLVAGGRGVAPMLFAAERLQARGRVCAFLFGARTQTHLVGLEAARTRIENAGGVVKACTDDGSAGRHGHVVDLLDELHETMAGPFVLHACGPHAMLHAVGEWGAKHGARTHVAMESYMACGTGVCRGCPLPRSERGRAAYGSNVPSLYGNREFAMCCTDGPVFEAGDLDWGRIE